MTSKLNDIIEQVVYEFNENSEDSKLVNSPDFVLMGDDSQLDSLGLVRFVVMVEQKLEQRYGHYIAVMDDSGLDESSNPFATIGSLTNHLTVLTENE